MQKYPLHVQGVNKKRTTAKTKVMSNKNNIQYVSANQNVSPIGFDTRWLWYLYSYGTDVHFIWQEGEFKLGSHVAQGDVESVEVETVERWGAEALRMQRREGYQTPYQTDKAIYLASQLSSMQLLSAK